MVPAKTDQEAIARGVAAAGGVLLEREEELARISAAVRSLADGVGGTLLISGAAGVGKTALIRETRGELESASVRALQASGAELEREFAYGVVRQLFEPELSRLTEGERSALFEGAAAGAAAVLGRSAAGDTTSGSDSDFGTLHSLFWLAIALAGDSPMAIVVDDAQWADAPSRRFLAFLARRLEGQAILLAVASRDDPRSSQADLIDPLRASAGTTKLEPSALGPEATRAFLAAHLERDVDTEFAFACLAATRGNPFLLGELAKTVASEGMEPTSENAKLVDRLGPESVSRAVLARLGGLGPETVEVARAVAILGRGTDVRDAGQLSGLDPETVSAAADELVEAQVFAPSRPVDFVHGIVRAAIYEDIAPGERATLHGRAARLLADRKASPEAVAGHLLPAEPCGDEWVCDQLVAAAEAAKTRGAPKIAVELLRRALDEPPGEAGRPALLASLGSLECRVGSERGVARLREARAITTGPADRAGIAHELAGALIFSGHATEAGNLLVEAIEELDAASQKSDPRVVAGLESLLLTAGVVTSGGHEIAQSRFEAIERRLEELPDAAARLVSAPLALERITCGGTAEIGCGLARRALADGRLIAEEGADSPVIYVALGALLWGDCAEEAEQAASVAIEGTQAAGSAPGSALALASRSMIRLRRGALADAAADAQTSLDLHGEAGGWQIFRMIATAAMASVLLERGELEEAATLLESVAQIPHDPDAVLLQPLREAQARLWLERSEPARSLQILLACEERESSWAIRSLVPVAWRSQAALAQLALGETEEARRLASEELELAREFGAARPLGLAQRALGLVEGGKAGTALLGESVATLADSSDRLEHARSMVELGASHRRAGERVEARDPLRAGLEAARACGATALAERAHEELTATGARPRKILYTGVDALTPSERRVASMAAEGMTNREIAQSLFVTPKTVEVHLSHSYSKLDISSRKQLAKALA